MQSDVKLDWQTVDRNLRSVAKRRAALDAEEARWLRQAEALRIWKHFGHPSLVAYLEHTLGYHPHAARDRVNLARALPSLPKIERALFDGQICFSAARELSRVATARTEGAWLDASLGKIVREVEVLVSGHEEGDLPTDPPKPEILLRKVHFEVKPDTYALMRQARTALEGEMGSLDDNAFINALCRRALAPTTERDRPLHQIAITVCESCKRIWQEGGGRNIEVPEETLERAECDAERIGSLQAENPSRPTKDISKRVRELVWHRDHGQCRVPGCRSAQHLDFHHIAARAKGGNHKPSNLMLCCDGHHTAIHDGLLTVTGRAPDELTFTRTDPTLRPSNIALARSALINSGFSKREAYAMVDAAVTHVGHECTLNQLVFAAFREA